MSNPSDYGDWYWCIKTSLSEDGEIYLNADEIEVTPTGALVCWRLLKTGIIPERHIVFAAAPGQWQAVYAASVIDGCAVAVDYWAGEVKR